ncbi:MAG TPA: Rne/Rng family ribonuclease [Xanthobacteraceae bacterium]
MPNKMLIDATHPEETRVVVLRGQRVEEFDFESASRKQLRGNIYLAKVTRVEPSLQAAFVDYGGNRHGFLAFSEIHPDYYQIPIADRQALIAEEERAQRAADAEVEHRVAHRQRGSDLPRDAVKSEPAETHGGNGDDTEHEAAAMAAGSELMAPEAKSVLSNVDSAGDGTMGESSRIPEDPPTSDRAMEPPPSQSVSAPETTPTGSNDVMGAAHDDIALGSERAESETGETLAGSPPAHLMEVNGTEPDEETIESVGGADAMEEVPERMPRLRRQYKIQEVIKRRQVMLVQVVKEERGTKGAALTTYLSLAGRYSVLMPNTARGGGISRKITSIDDRRRLKEIAQELDVPEGMGVILRTAGASRTKTEVKRDFEYLLRVWETVRDLTLKSTAPKLVYEEGSLVKRSIRDLYNKEIDEIAVAGEHAYQEAKDFMRMLMPSHAKNVRPYTDGLPIFTRYGIESQLDAMFTPVMQLRSGGYIVINQAEALVAIDVNSGRATREHHIEDTALKTNLEAAEEIARQLRLRDLAGLIVIDFIDMDEKRNNRAVERRLKECLRHDRARIQVGHISHFGLLEMSRQRIRSSVLESSTEKCPNCGGTGHVRSVASVSLQLLRALEEMLLKGATHNVIVRTRSDAALYLLNLKRAHLRGLEERFHISIVVNADPTMAGQVSFLIERGEQVHSLEQARALAAQAPAATVAPERSEEAQEEFEEIEAPSDEAPTEAAVVALDDDGFEPLDDDEDQPQAADLEPTSPDTSEHAGGRKKRRRRRGRRVGEPDARQVSPRIHAAGETGEHGDTGEQHDGPSELTESGADARDGTTSDESAAEANGDSERRRRRRGRRGGRRNRRERDHGPALPEAGELEPELVGAVTDLDLPHDDMEASVVGHEPQPPAPPGAEPEPAIDSPDRSASAVADPHSSAASSSGAPRGRSTVREPAFASLPEEAREGSRPAVDTSEVLSEPVVSSPQESNAAERPRRSGWWSKRLLGRD